MQQQIRKEERIVISHGNGGQLMQELIRRVFVAHFDNEYLRRMDDAALLELPSRRVAFTTDSYVVNPLFFPGGDIGKLAICGTINDLAVMCAEPRYISCGFIIEEGFPFDELERIVVSMQETAKEAEVEIVAGDTKVVEHGSAHRMFINTSGIGVMRESAGERERGAQPGDKIVINGGIGEHGIAVLAARKSFDLEVKIESDCAALNELIAEMCEASRGIHFMRDPTRGGVAAALNEMVTGKPFGALLYEDAIPMKDEVAQVCEILGFDPLYIANEGKVIAVIKNEDAEGVLATMRKHPLGKDAAIIGEVSERFAGKVVMKTAISGHRIVDMLVSDEFPRIC
jgi:hydrogenase expression/formation protein HypE